MPSDETEQSKEERIPGHKETVESTFMLWRRVTEKLEMLGANNNFSFLKLKV